MLLRVFSTIRKFYLISVPKRAYNRSAGLKHECFKFKFDIFSCNLGHVESALQVHYVGETKSSILGTPCTLIIILNRVTI